MANRYDDLAGAVRGVVDYMASGPVVSVLVGRCLHTFGPMSGLDQLSFMFVSSQQAAKIRL